LQQSAESINIRLIKVVRRNLKQLKHCVKKTNSLN